MSYSFVTQYSDKSAHLCLKKGKHIDQQCTYSCYINAFCIRHGDVVGLKYPAKHFSMTWHAPNSDKYLAEFAY